MYARGTASDNYSRLVDFYEENMHNFDKEIKHMFISSYSEFWESEWGREEMLPQELETLQKLMNKEHDQIEPLTTKEFRKFSY